MPEYYESAAEIVEAYNSGELAENYPMLAEAIKLLLQEAETTNSKLVIVE